jgi:hypothetical protein
LFVFFGKGKIKILLKRLGQVHKISKYKKLAAILDSLSLEFFLREYNILV